MRIVIATALLAAISSCGNDCDIATFDGIYRLSYTEQSGGTCGPFADVDVEYDNGLMAISAACTRTASSWDDCNFTASMDCEFPSADRKDENAVDIEWQSDGERFSGTLVFSQLTMAGAVTCSSNYDIVGTRVP